MSIEALGAYSQSTVYGQLTSPFTPKQVTINSHTPYDKIDEDKTQGVYSRSSFEAKPQPKMVYDDMADKKSVYEENEFLHAEKKEVLEEYKLNKNALDMAKESEVNSFSASQMSSNQVLRSSLKCGYSTTEAVVIAKAHDAYKRSALITNKPADVLSTCSYRVF